VARKRRVLRVGPIRLRLTRAGWLFLLVSVLVGVASAKNHESPLVFVLFGVMMGSLMVSITLAGRTIAGVRVVRSAPERVWQGQVANVGYYLRNRRRGGACLALSLHEAPADGADSVGGYCVHLAAQNTFRAAGRIMPMNRGRLKLTRIDLETTFPFGLVRASRRIRQAASMVVWPARGLLRQRLLHRGAVETSSAPPSQVSGGQDEFFGLREYRPGDNPRWIHWRRSATRDAPVVREMARPRPDTLWVIVDTHWPEASEEGNALRERALRFAATLIDHAFVRGCQVGLAVASGHGPFVRAPRPGRGQRSALLDALSDVPLNTTVTLEAVLAGLGPRHFDRSQAIVVTPRAHLPGADLRNVRRACRHLTVIGSDRMARAFQDCTPDLEEIVPCR